MTMPHVDIEFPSDYFGRGELETPAKGWLAVTVLVNGERYPLHFYDPTRLRQTLEDIVADKRGIHFTEPGLVIVPEVTTEVIRRAVADLAAEGYFDSLRPIGRNG